MPELPEVETIRRDLKTVLVGLKIKKVNVYDKRVIFKKTPQQFSSLLINKRILDIDRRGKALILKLSSGLFVAVQLKMTGQLIYTKEDFKSALNCKETKLSLKLSNGKFLNYNDQRIFGKFILERDLSSLPYFSKLGVEPLGESFTLKWLQEKLRAKKTPIKHFLMDQSNIAGIGNIYASEILFESKINPRRLANGLSAKETGLIFKATKDILTCAVKNRGTSFRDYRDASGKKGNYIKYLQVYGRESEKCFRCNGAISRISQQGRSTFYCSKCQGE